jgi:protein-disulfide isomerase
MRTPIVNAISLLALAGVVTVAAAFRHAPVHASAYAAIPVPAQAGDSLSTAADANRTDGSATSKVWVVEISDLQCPFCKRWHDEVFPKVRDEYIKTGKIRFAYVNFPLSQHQNAFQAATAAMCGSAQGKFWQMHDALFSTQEKWEGLSNPSAYFESLASKAGMNMPRWKSCLSAPSIKALIEADRDRAQRAGVQSTPSFIIANKLIDGAMPWNDMKKAIDNALAAAH